MLSMKPSPKKSETLQVRLPHGVKQDFMERCRLEGQAASEVLRDFIDGYLARPVEILTSEKAVMIRKRFVYPAFALAAAIGGIVVLIPRPGQAGEDLKGVFAQLDTNHDGVLTAEELQPPQEGFSLSRSRVVAASTGAASTMKRVVTVSGPRPWPVLAQEVIDTMDQDGDHRMNLAEYKAFRISSAQQTFMIHDTNRDGRLSREEFVNPPVGAPARAKETMARKATALSARFDELDTDHDGFLSPGEQTPG